MITKIELSGFKTFHSFSLDTAPFQVIVGANGAGKSNLFDALRLLSELAASDLRSAFQGLRGEAGELFTLMPDGRPVDRMRLCVEMLVQPQVQDSWGAQAELKHTRLRYELEIERRQDDRGLERLYVAREELKAILRRDDKWLREYVGTGESPWRPPLTVGRTTPYISTEDEDGTRTISLHQDGRAGRKAKSVAEKVERTVLSGVTSTEFPHAFAAHEEMRTWRLLQLNPAVLREPSNMLGPRLVQADGSCLPSALARMRADDGFALDHVSRDLANLVPGISNIEVEADEARQRYVVWAGTDDGRRFSSRVLSDGTLRLLALVTLRNDLQHRGTLCFEEPENGVHPRRLRELVGVLRRMTTDFDEADPDETLRQLLVNTHSPVLVAELVSQGGNQRKGFPELLFAQMTTRVVPGEGGPLQVTRITPVRPNQTLKLDLGLTDKEEAYTLARVLEYLDTADADEATAALQRTG